MVVSFGYVVLKRELFGVVGVGDVCVFVCKGCKERLFVEEGEVF